MPKDPYNWINKNLDTIHKADWYRSVNNISDLPGPTIILNGEQVINFASNDYLGLAGDQRLIESAIASIKQYGTGTTGSRLLTGNRPLHNELEQAIALLKNTEDAIVFSSGYLANLGTISALVGKRDLILADQYNHSSLKKGAILSGATIINYQHCQINDLKKYLSLHREKYQKCLIITDTVFSMDGDLCPLPEILNLGEEYECMVLIDEAHSTGIFGENGSGCVEYFKCGDRPLIIMGTLSKAIGSLGGYVAGKSNLIDFLKNRASTWIYTTGLSIGDTGAALTAIDIVKKEPKRRQKLWHNVAYFQQLIKEQLPNLNFLPSNSPIISLQLENPKIALQLAEKLKQSGIFAPAIRPPTVPTSRIR
ncbi:MAG TPA: 8-amino-7-oxononanoate synthase, partial [Allocoleopsis sp.]